MLLRERGLEFTSFVITWNERVIILGSITSKINGTSQRCLLVYFEATLDFTRSEFTCT